MITGDAKKKDLLEIKEKNTYFQSCSA